MANTLSVRREMFARLLVDGHRPSQAYRLAGFSSGNNSSALRRQPAVAARIAELREEQAAEGQRQVALRPMEQTVDGIASHQQILRELCSNVLKARRIGDFNTSNASLQLLKRAIGMNV